MAELTKKIAEYVQETKWEQIPPDAAEASKLHILDTLGCMIAGSRERAPEIVNSYVESLGSRGECSVIPTSQKTSAPYAALANGVSGHVLDYDDYDWSSMAHPSITVLPAVLALGEQLNAGGKECLVAYLAGVEVIAKMGVGINPDHYDKGWHSTGTLGPLGAAAASSKLLKLDIKRSRRALGIAASLSSGLRGNFGTMTKPFHAGHASRCGVEAALLASRGFSANESILESELGFCNLYTSNGSFDLEAITSHLGNPFSISSPGIGIKPYPSCAATHSSLDAILSLVQELDIRPDDVQSVECGIFYLYPSMLIHSLPKTGLEGKFSLEFCMALAIKQGKISLNHFRDSVVGDPQIRELTGKVNKYVTKEVGERGTRYPGAIVTVKTRSGKTHVRKIGKRKGSPENPLEPGEIINKFRDAAGLVLPSNQVNAIVAATMSLDQTDHIREIVSLLLKEE